MFRNVASLTPSSQAQSLRSGKTCWPRSMLILSGAYQVICSLLSVAHCESHRCFLYQKTHSKSLSQLINEIETLRIRRQDQYHHYPSPQLKVFSQQELNDAACPSYKNYLNGRTRKVLSREAILSIAEYLECTLQQINELLLCAGYLPIATDPDGIALDMRLEEGRATLQLLSFPAVLSTRDWRVKGTNSLYTSFWNVPAWEQTPSDKQHNLHLLFHADVVHSKRERRLYTVRYRPFTPTTSCLCMIAGFSNSLTWVINIMTSSSFGRVSLRHPLIFRMLARYLLLKPISSTASGFCTCRLDSSFIR